MEYKTGSGYPIERFIEFGNIVFGDEVLPGGFDCLLPKLTKVRSLPEHFRVIEEEGELKAMLLSLPLHLKIYDQMLSIRYIGLVAVHESARGKGYMTLLLEQAMKEMKEEKTVLVFSADSANVMNTLGTNLEDWNFVASLTKQI